MAAPYNIAAIGLYDVSARQDASYSIDDYQPFSTIDPSFYEDETPESTKYATGEEDYFLLDGTFHPFPDNPYLYEFALWSKTMSDEQGEFNAPLKLIIDFINENHTSGGLTFHFNTPTDDYPSHMRIAWFDQNGSLITRRDFYPDSAVYYAEATVIDYRRIEIDFLSTSKPYRYLKLLNIDFGLERVFGLNNIMAASLKEYLNPLSTEIPINRYTVKLFSEDDDFSPLNPKGTYALLQQKQRVMVYQMVDDEQKFLGGFYIDTWSDATENTITLKAVDSVGILDNIDFEGDVYDRVPAAQIIAEIMATAELVYELDESLRDIPISGHLPYGKCRAALQQVAVAIGAVVHSSRNDILRITPPPERPSSYIRYRRKFFGDKIKQRSYVSGVEVTSHTYLPGPDEEEFYRNETTETWTDTLRFPEPVYRAFVQDGEFVGDPRVNVATVRSYGTGELVVYGIPYVDNRKVFSYHTEVIPAGQTSNPLTVEEATLIGESNALALAEKVYDYYQNRLEFTGSILCENEAPGDYVIIDSLRKEKIKGYVESMSFSNLQNSFKAEIKVVGQRIETFEGHYSGEIMAGENLGVM